MPSLIQYTLIYLATLPFLFGVDLLWITVIAKPFYQSHLGHLLADKPILWVGALFYLLYLVGIMVFAIAPAIETHSLLRAIVLGALLGCIAYAAYDFTNWSTIKDWPMIVSVVDLLWGTVLTGAIAGIGYTLATAFILR
jgi:uncharacterized membrane protein